MQVTPCYLCGLQLPLPLTVQADVPTYSSSTDSISIMNRRVCKTCNTVLLNIQQFVLQNQLKYNNPHYKNQVLLGSPPVKTTHPKKALQVIYEATSKNKLTRSQSDSKSLLLKRVTSKQPKTNEQSIEQQQIHPYVMLIIEEMRQKNYVMMLHLPKTLLYLIHLSTSGTLLMAEERHQKIKNVILLLAETINLSVEQLPYVLLLANFLFCLMDSNKVVTILNQLSNVIVTYPHLISWKSLILQQQKINEVPQSPATLELKFVLLKVDKLLTKIQMVIDLGRKSQNCLRECLVRLAKIDLNLEWKDYRRRAQDSVKSLNGKDDLNEDQLALLYHLKLQRNSFNLILRQILKDEEQIKQELAHQTHIFIREKEEYVDKIIQLTQKIQGLEQRIKDMEQQYNKQSQKQQSYITDAVPLSQQIPDMDPQKKELAVQQQAALIQKIIIETDIFGFNSKSFASQDHSFIQKKANQLSQVIILQIIKLQKGYQNILSKIKVVEAQKTTLLDILTRKEDRMIGVITEKDVIIDRYEQALWRMENGLMVTEEPMAHRIRYIMHIFSEKPKAALEKQSKEKSKDGDKKESDCQIY